MSIIHVLLDIWDKVIPRIRAWLAQRSTLMPGVVPVKALAASKRLRGEVFAAELLRQPVRLEKDANAQTIIEVNRTGVKEAVISNKGKTLLCDKYVAPHQDTLRAQDIDYHKFLLDPSATGSKTIRLDKFPLRWASGGVVSVVSLGGRKWIPLFFRDIRPYGWNVSLGASERYFDEDGRRLHKFDRELENPAHLIAREFLEETLVLNNAPRPGENTSHSFALPFWQGTEAEQKQLQVSAEHRRLRATQDKLRIYSDEHTSLSASSLQTAMTVKIARDQDTPKELTEVIVCVNLLELGIEVVKVISYALGKDDYFLDGEILENDPKELVRMPMALISCDYLRSTFGDHQRWTYTLGPQPSVRALGKLPEEEIRLFEWDVLLACSPRPAPGGMRVPAAR